MCQGLIIATIVAGTVAIAAFDQALDAQGLAEAIQIGTTRVDDTRSRFHAPYRVEAMQPPVDYIDVVTPFRRVVLDAEGHTRAGAGLYGQREAIATLGDTPSRLDLVVDLTFHPLNNFIRVPDYTVTLVTTAGNTIAPTAIQRLPRFGPRLSGALSYPYASGGAGPQNGEAISGGMLVAQFDGRALDPRGVYTVLIREAGKDVAKASVNLGRLR
jgi:hypothetical protein